MSKPDPFNAATRRSPARLRAARLQPMTKHYRRSSKPNCPDYCPNLPPVFPILEAQITNLFANLGRAMPGGRSYRGFGVNTEGFRCSSSD
jgi:hypothetical protein